MTAPPALRRSYELTCEVLSPLHISLGTEALLIPDEECDVAGELTYVLDRPALIAELLERPAAPAPPPRRRTYRDILLDRDHPQHDMTRRLFQAGWINPDDPVEEEDPPAAGRAGPDLSALAATRPRDLPPAERHWRRAEGRRLVAYLLDGTPDVPGRQEWWESISRLPRTPDGRILIAGSSLKGALRSVLAYAMAERLGPDTLPPAAPRHARDKFAARPLERRTLAPHAPRTGNAPNYDAGRLLLARDTALDVATRARITPFGLRGGRGWRPFSAGTRQSAAAVEAIPPGATFRARLAVDVFLLEGWRDQERNVDVFGPLREVLADDLAPLLRAGRAFAAAMLEADAAFYRAMRAARAAALTETLRGRLATLPADATLLRLGWGAGRTSKTPFGVLLNQSPPRSRRLTVEPDGEPGLPFGWLICTVRPHAPS